VRRPRRQSQRRRGRRAAEPVDLSRVDARLRQLEHLKARFGADAVVNAVRAGVTLLEKNYCAGYQLRGTKTTVCVLHLGKTKWRLVYLVDHSRRTAELRLLAEHYLPSSVMSYLRADLAKGSPLSQKLRWDDVYREVVRVQSMDPTEVAAMVAEVRGVESTRWTPCCT
jgi:hypothetical protein